VQLAYGSSHSTGRPDNDDGYWKAVDVCVFASAPPGRKAEPSSKVPVVVFRETVEIRKTYKSGDDHSQSEHFGMFTAAQAIAKDVYRIQTHPCEQGDPDNGKVNASRTEKIPREYAPTFERAVDQMRPRRDNPKKRSLGNRPGDARNFHTFQSG
jgi:hypothetical protein